MKLLCRGSSFFGILLLSMASLTATADTSLPPFGVFTMLEGQGVDVCEACLKALEALPSDLTGCERNYDPALGFEVGPFWEEISPRENLALLKKVMLLIQPPPQGISGSIFDGRNFDREIRGQMEHGGIELSLAKIDIDNDGRSEPVLRFRKGACIGHGEALHVQYQPLLVLQADRLSVDLGKTDLVMQNPKKRKDLPFGSVWERIYDVFQYKGAVYFDKWEWDDYNTADENFSIFQAVSNNVNPLCKYRYERRYQSQVQGKRP